MPVSSSFSKCFSALCILVLLAAVSFLVPAGLHFSHLDCPLSGYLGTILSLAGLWAAAALLRVLRGFLKP